MMDTKEFLTRIDKVESGFYPKNGFDFQERLECNRQRMAAVAALEAEWHAGLRAEYLRAGAPDVVHEAVLSLVEKAMVSYDYQDFEKAYSRAAALVNLAYENLPETASV